MFRPDNLVQKEDDIRQILSKKVNGPTIGGDEESDSNLGVNATKFPWPWPKDTPIFEIINEDLQQHPWKRHFKETIQFTMELQKLVTSLKVNYTGRLKIRIEFKTSFRNENTLIPNLYIKANTWERAHVLHAPTHSSQQEGEHWLRNVLGNIYLFGHALFVEHPTVDHTAMLLYMFNHKKEGVKTPSPGKSRDQSPKQFENSRLFKHFNKDSRAPIPLPIHSGKPKSRGTFTRQAAANAREFKPRQNPAPKHKSIGEYDDLYARYRASRARGYGARTSYPVPAREYPRYERQILPRPMKLGELPPTAQSFEEYAQLRQRYEEQMDYARMYHDMYGQQQAPRGRNYW